MYVFRMLLEISKLPPTDGQGFFFFFFFLFYKPKKTVVDAAGNLQAPAYIG
jgi:hypothetical protein